MLRLNQHNIQGDITAESSEYVKLRDKVRAEDKARKDAADKRKADARSLRFAYIRCSAEGAECTCGQSPCVVQVYSWCVGCEQKGRNPLTKKGCGKRDCATNAAPAVVPPPLPFPPLTEP